MLFSVKTNTESPFFTVVTSTKHFLHFLRTD